MKSAYEILRRPVITEKGLAIKENENTLVFQVAKAATKTEIKEAVQIDFQSEGRLGAHGELSRQRAPPRKFRGLPSGLEKSIRAFEGWREDAGVRAELVRQRSAVSRQLSVKAAAGRD